VRVGSTGTFQAIGYDTSGARVPGVPAAWSTSNAAVATVDSRGRARGISEGSAVVYADYDSLRDSAVVIVQPAQDGWFIQASNANNADLRGVHFLPDGRSGWAVGDGGKIVSTSDGGSLWASQVSNTSFDLNGVWFTSALKGWAVGNGGTVLHTVNGGTTWTRIDAGTNVRLEDACFADDSTGWIVGAGVVLRTMDEGDTWTRSFPTSQELYSVSFSGPHGWAVGQGGIILGTHDSGATWFIVQPSITSRNLNAVWRRSEAFALAVGDLGDAPRTVPGATPGDTTHWAPGNAGPLNRLFGVHFPTDLIGFAVGDQSGGVVRRSDDGGVSWRTQISNAQFQLEDVFFVDDRRGWAVGHNGVIIHTGTGGDP
jgi:photosystem II stability/assembly factor-like uncharacterized protein